MNTTTNWSALIDANPSVVQDFVAGTSYRKMAQKIDCPDTRSIVWQLERTLPVDKARDRARKALRRRGLSVN